MASFANSPKQETHSNSKKRRCDIFPQEVGINRDEIEENVVSFTLYDLNGGCLEMLKDRVYQELEPFLQDYIWQKDPFSIHSSLERSTPWNNISQGINFLWGHVHYGDSVDDEWFLVALLWKLSEALPFLAIQIWDDDGEFLLIEAAFVLPKWIKPETSRNRVWIKEGTLHIIPKSFPESGDLGSLCMSQALSILASNVKTEAKTEMQQLIKTRIRTFPHDVSRSQHKAKCYLPLKAAYILSQNPQIVSNVVELFINRDESDLETMKNLAFFKGEEFVMTVVKFHRCSYAQLMQTEFNLPQGLTLEGLLQSGSRAKSNGVKLMYAMELFLQKCLNSETGGASSAAPSYLPVSLTLVEDLKEALKADISPEEFMMQNNLIAEDDDAWLHNGEKDLETELLKREKEQDGCNANVYNPDDLDPTEFVDSFSAFVDKVSSYEGAEVPDCVRFDAHTFMKELKKAMGDDLAEEFEKLDVSTSDSDFHSGESSDDEENTDNVSDSDDDSEFAEAYDKALKTELKDSTMNESFVQKNDLSETSLPDVDLNMNLVKNLLQSCEEEQGLSGPVSNLAGLMKLNYRKERENHSNN